MDVYVVAGSQHKMKGINAGQEEIKHSNDRELYRYYRLLPFCQIVEVVKRYRKYKYDQIDDGNSSEELLEISVF